jgi:hypothetical protein
MGVRLSQACLGRKMKANLGGKNEGKFRWKNGRKSGEKVFSEKGQNLAYAVSEMEGWRRNGGIFPGKSRGFPANLLEKGQFSR